MPPVFTKAFADRLNACSALSVKEAEDGDPLLRGTALIAPGDYHLSVVRAFPQPHIMLSRTEPVSGHRPSVDVLMQSVAREYGSSAVGVIMTGMGKDGAEGIGKLHRTGAVIIAQDKESSVIFGMNREVILNGDADAIASVDRIAETLRKLVVAHERI
jgi:two-component system chemotaxis response regulator CheB